MAELSGEDIARRYGGGGGSEGADLSSGEAIADAYRNAPPPTEETTTEAPARPPRPYESLHALVAPSPGYVASGILPLQTKETYPGSGQGDPSQGWKLGWGLLGSLFDLGVSAAEGPATGTVTPDVTMALLGSKAPSPMRGARQILGREPIDTTPLPAPAMSEADRATAAAPPRLSPLEARVADVRTSIPPPEPPPPILSEDFRANPLAAGAQERVAAAPGTAGPNMLDPNAASRTVPAEPAAQGSRSLVPTASEPPVLPKGAAKTVADAKAVADSLYTKADQAGGTLAPALVDRFIDTVKRAAPQTEEGKVVTGETSVTKLIERMQDLRGKPISLRGAKEIDEGLGQLIEKEVTPQGKLTADGNALHDLQTTFRDMIEGAPPSEMTGGKAGFEALAQARKAWSQAMKMGDLERIQARSELGAHPDTMIQTQIRTLLASKRARGYSADEKAALLNAAKRGTLGGALHVFGSRLIPVIAAAGGFAGGTTTGTGLLAMALSASGAHVATTGARAMATRLANNRLNNAMQVLGKSVPPPARTNLLAPPT